MIRIVCCPSCDEKGALLADIAPGEKITCAQCTNQFDPAAATVETLPIIVATTGGETSSSGSDSELKLRDEEPAKGGPTSDPSKWQSYEPITHDQFERLKRKNRSPIWSILQIGLGGAAAIPIALLILWHGLGRDVMDAGPTVAKYAPWIVPEKFHPFEPEDTQDDPSPQPRRSGGFRNFDKELGLDVGDEPAESAEVTPPLGASPEQQSSDNMPAMPPADELDRARVQELFPFTRGLFRSINSYEADLATWLRDKDTPGADLSSIAKKLYGDLLSISHQLQQFPSESPVFKFIRNEMSGASGRVKRDLATQKLISAGARHTLSAVDWPTTTSISIAMIIKIKEAERDGPQWSILPEHSETPSELFPGKLSVQLPTYLSPALIPKQKLLVLGTLNKGSEGNITLQGNYLYSFGSRDTADASSDSDSTDDATTPLDQ